MQNIILEKIKEKVDKLNLKISDKYYDSLISIILFKISQNEYFKENFNFFSLVKLDNRLLCYSPNLNNVRGATNKKLNQFIIDIYEEDYVYDNFENKNIKLIYLKESEFNAISDFLNVFNQSKNFNELSSGFKKINDFNSDFSHILSNYLLNSDKNKNLYELISNYIILDKEQLGSEKYKSYHDNFNRKKDQLPYFISSNYIINNLFIEKDNIETILLSIFQENKKNIIEKLFYYDECLTNKELLNFLKNEEFSSKEKCERFLKSDLMLAKSITKDNFEKRLYEIFNLSFIKNKDKIKNELYDSIKIFHKQDEIKLFNSNIVTKIYNETISEIYEFNNDETYSLEMVLQDGKPLNEFYSSHNSEMYDNMKKLNSLSITNNHHYDSLIKGQEFFNVSDFNSSFEKPHIYIIAKTKNEIIGLLKAYEINDSCIAVAFSFVNTYKRGMGVGQNLYEKLFNYAVENEKIIINTMYTEKGNMYIPRIKDKIMNLNPNGLFIDKDRGRYIKSRVLDEFNSELIEYLQNSNISINYNKFVKMYKDLSEKIKNKDFLDYDEKRTIILELMENSKNNKKIKNKI